MGSTFEAQSLQGLSNEEAARRLSKDGSNEVAEPRESWVRRIVGRFWAPIPWMLEAAIGLQLITGEWLEALIIGALLVFNVVLGLAQEERATGVLDALKQKLAPIASVHRDGAWSRIPAADIVIGDLVQLSLGCIVPADLRILTGSVLLDQSMLTGESAPIEAGAGSQAYAGALVRRGSAAGVVTATGSRTYFGRTAELVKIASSESTEQRAVLTVVRNLAVFNATVVVALLVYVHMAGMPLSHTLPLVLTAVLASIPVALPATFTLSGALGAQQLAREGVLLTRLSALHEAAAVDVLCVDKTGTLTANTVRVEAVSSASPQLSESDVLAYAALASAEGSLDAVDAAIRHASAERLSSSPILAGAKVISFTPFDPGSRTAEAQIETDSGRTLRVLKGAPSAVAVLASGDGESSEQAQALTRKGLRVLAVACGEAQGRPTIIGFIGLGDPPRQDSAPLLARLRALGVRPVMVTGDAAPTAAVVATQVGLGSRVATPALLRTQVAHEGFDVFAEVFPEDKFHLVKGFQDKGHVVAMCGDGVNDAPALRQAQAGIAVATATDAAKKAAAMVLTQPGLNGIVTAILEGRRAYERLTTYATNALAKKFQLVLFLAAGVLLTGHALLTPMLMALLLVTGDFITMALTTDRVAPSSRPTSWDIAHVTRTAALYGLGQFAFSTGLIAVAFLHWGMHVEPLRSLAFLTLVLGSQVIVYAARERRHGARTRPGRWLIASSVLDTAIAVALTTTGVFMAPLSFSIVGQAMLATLGFFALLELAKAGRAVWMRARGAAAHLSSHADADEKVTDV